MLGAVIAALTLSTAARAQNTAGDDEPGGGGNSASPIDGRGFSLGASLRTLYDGNIRRVGNGFPLRDGDSRSDFRFSPLVTAAVGYPLGRQQLFLDGEVGRDFYARNNDLNRNRYGAGGGLIWRLGRACTGAVTGDFRRRQALLSESSGQGDNTQDVTILSANGDCVPGVGIGFGGGVSHRATDNKTLIRRAFDSRDTTFDAHLNFSTPALGTFSAGGTYSKISYPERDVTVALEGGGIGTVDDKLNSWSARLGFARSLGSRLSVNASASYIKVKPDPRDTLAIIELPGGFPVAIPNAREGYSGPGYNLAINYTPSPRLSASLAASRNATSSSNVGARIDVRDSVTGVINYNLGASISTAIGASYDRRRYKGSFANEADPLRRIRDSIGRVFGRVSYQPRPLYGVDFELAHQKRDSNPSEYNFSATSASVVLHVKFGKGN